MLEPVAIYYEHCESGWHVPEAPTNNHILLLLTHGAITYRIEDRDYRLTKGDLLYVPQGAVRSAFNPSTEHHEMYVAHYQYSGDGDGLPILTHHHPRHVSLMQFDYMRQRFSLLAQHWLRKHRYGPTLIHSVLLEMLAIVEEENASHTHEDKAYSLVSQLQNHIATHYRRTIPMQELARLVDRTPNYVSRLFKEATGQTITDYIQQIRITAACDLLANSQMNVGEVSDFLGFCEQSYFNKVFKRLTGTLPSTYMKEKVKIWKSTNNEGS